MTQPLSPRLKVFRWFVVALAAFALSSCEKKGDAQSPNGAGEEQSGGTLFGFGECSDNATAMGQRLTPFTKVQPDIETQIDLPEATGSVHAEGTPMFVGKDFVEVDGTRYDVPESDDPVANGSFSDSFVETVGEALATKRKEHAKEAKLLNEYVDFVVSLGVHPDITAGAVEPYFGYVKKPYRIALLAFDAEAPEIPERKTHKDVEPLLEKLDAAESEEEIERLTGELKTRVIGDCEIAFFRIWMGDKTGTSTLDRRELLKAPALDTAVTDCGCSEVDIPALEAALGWAMTPPHARLVVLPTSYDRTFGAPEKKWSDVVADQPE